MLSVEHQTSEGNVSKSNCLASYRIKYGLDWLNCSTFI